MIYKFNSFQFCFFIILNIKLDTMRVIFFHNNRTKNPIRKKPFEK